MNTRITFVSFNKTGSKKRLATLIDILNKRRDPELNIPAGNPDIKYPLKLGKGNTIKFIYSDKQSIEDILSAKKTWGTDILIIDDIDIQLTGYPAGGLSEFVEKVTKEIEHSGIKKLVMTSL